MIDGSALVSVSCHVVSRAIDKLDRSSFYYVMNEVVAYIDVLGASMVVAVLSQSNDGFAVTEQNCQCLH